MARRAALIINPASGGAGQADMNRLEGIATGMGYELDVIETERAGHATELAAEAIGSFDIVIAAGGDGTITETVNGLAGTDIPLGIVPLGTANVLARETGIPLTPHMAFEAALSRAPQSISLGHMEAGGLSSYFCLMAGVGYDASVVHNVNTGLKKVIGKGAYVLKALETLALWSAPELGVTVDGKANECQTVVICNARKYGGDLIMAPGADIGKPGFEVIMLKGKGRTELMNFLISFGLMNASARHLNGRNVEVVSGQDIRVEGNAHIQLDGDDFGPAPALISARPDALRLVF